MKNVRLCENKVRDLCLIIIFSDVLAFSQLNQLWQGLRADTVFIIHSIDLCIYAYLISIFSGKNVIEPV